MQVREIMTVDPACCTPDTRLQDVAQMMVDCDCGAIPVVSDTRSGRVVGIITDRDITCRTVAQGKNPFNLKAGDCMSTDVACVIPGADLKDLERIMEERQVRRVPVVDETGCCCGIVAQADIALNAPKSDTAEVVREISQTA